jgi:protein-S-isoprenylcysteine O-methyltransferase Ste14
MCSLELKVPPPIVALLTGVAMWLVSPLGPSVDLPPRARAVCMGTIAVCGGALALAGSIAFRRARTTINPLRPTNASSLVTSGIYRFTRNPMYLGLFLVLIAWAVRLSTFWVFAGPLFFVVYIRRFQIAPEERALAAKFGKDYTDYTTRVRRWF